MPAWFFSSYFVLFAIIAIGLAIGNLSLRGMSLDVSAVIFIALIFGHYGLSVPKDLQDIGLLLFIFTIGIQAGPGFFETFRKQGLQMVMLTVIVVFAGALVTALLSYVYAIDFKMASGIFAGALTSTPGLAASIEAANSPLASIGYGIAYPFGVIGVILFMRMLPKILRADLVQAGADYCDESQVIYPEILNRNFIVENRNAAGKTIGEVSIRSMTGASISRIMHDGIAVTPSNSTQVFLGDLVKAVGSQTALEKIKLLLGPITDREIPLSTGYDVQWVLVTNKKVVGKSLAQVNLLANFNATVTRIRRSGIDISPKPRSILRFGDKLMVASDKENMIEVSKLLGNREKSLSETDFLPIALGIVAGVLLGHWQIPLFGSFSFKLGLTGGILAAAIILSRIGKTGPIIWALSGNAVQVLRQIGLLFFLAAVGTEAGAHIEEALTQYGVKLLLVGGAITFTPLLVGALLGHFLFRINILTLLGALTGAMTSTPGLAAVDPMTECNAPQIAYAAVYPVALVCTIICAQIIARL